MKVGNISPHSNHVTIDVLTKIFIHELVFIFSFINLYYHGNGKGEEGLLTWELHIYGRPALKFFLLKLKLEPKVHGNGLGFFFLPSFQTAFLPNLKLPS